jgi:2,3-bisphosphoglycerate-independent phosphoglycerate mutase
MPEFHMYKINTELLTFTRYDETFRNNLVLFEKEAITKTLGEVLAEKDLSQIRIAETEKYPHVTFFFSGGREIPFENERRILIPSPQVATYDLKPEMSAPELRDAIIEEIINNPADFICLNFANADMVGHTGVLEAAIKAVETVDRCLGAIIEHAEKAGYSMLIIADHGNADYMINPDGSPNTAHSKNPVPCILTGNKSEDYVLTNGRLADIAPTVLSLMGLEIPAEMTGKVLVTTVSGHV